MSHTDNHSHTKHEGFHFFFTLVLDLEEKLHRTETDRRNSLQRTRLLEEQLMTVRGELADTRGHLEELRDVLQRTQLASDQRQATIHQLTAELR